MGGRNRGAANSHSTALFSNYSCTLSTTWLLVLSLAVTTCSHVTTALPAGFVAEVVSQVKATTGRFAPHPQTGKPMLLVVHKDGEVHVVLDVESGTDNGRQILDLRDNNQMCTNGERGLQSIEVHPNFSDNRWVYLFYNKYQADCLEDPNKGPHNVVARFTMNADSLELEDEQILLQGAPLDKRVHNGGAMLFSGDDNKLYVTTGDAGIRENAQNLKNLHGSLLRLNDDGSVPSDNPFVEDGTGVPCGQSGGKIPKDAPDGAVCSEIWAWGFRNPFRMARDSASTGRFAISDVGAQHWEELSWGGSDLKAANYGWPTYEGPCKAEKLDNCETPPEGSNSVPPFHFYQHKSVENGGCVSGSTFVQALVWPEEFKFLFIDFIFLKIYNLVENASAECMTCSPPTSGYRNETFYESIQKDNENVNEARMVDMFFGPYQDTVALYVIKYGNNDSLIRIRYTGSMNIPPLPKIVVQNPSVQQQQDDDHILVGNIVQYDGSQSSDPDGETLSYQWSFGDGNKSTNKSPRHVYNKPGEYRVTLIVTDEDGQAQQDSITVVVGQPPTASIVSPAEGTTFDVGQVLKLKGLAFDSNGDVIPDNQIIWEVRQHHADHYHPFLDETIGNSIDLFPAPDPEDFFAATNSFLKVIMTAIDTNGVTTEIFRDVKPRTVTIDIQTEPAGLEVVVDDFTVLAPQEIVSWVNHELLLRVQDQPPFVFQEWGDGKTSKSMNMTLLSNDTRTVVVARFCLEKNSFCGDSWICCSGVCNDSGMCANASQTEPPFGIDITTGEYTDLPEEDDVDDTFGDVPTLPGVGNTLGDNSVDFQSSNNNNLQNTRDDDGLEPSEKWLLSLLTFVVILFPFCMGLFYCRRGRSGRTDLVNRSLDDSEDNEAEEASIIFAISRKESSSVTSAICEKLAEENERRSKLRAKLDGGNLAPAGETGTPETVADTPTSNESTSAALSTTIDETLVRLDDILSRTFQLSRRRREQSTPEKLENVDAMAERAIVGPLEPDVDGGYLDSFSHILFPLANSAGPDSPLREDPANSFAFDTVGYSFVSNGLEDGLNDSAVQFSDTHSVHSGSGRLLCQKPTVPVSLLDASGADSAAEYDFFPDSLANAVNEVNLESLRGDDPVAVQNEGDCRYTVTAPHTERSRSEDCSLSQVATAAGDGKLEVNFIDTSNEDNAEESLSSHGDDSSENDDKNESQRIEYMSSYSVDSASGHSLV